MKITARNGQTYDVSTAPPGGVHEVRLGGDLIGTFVLLPRETKVTVKNKKADDGLLVDIADRFVEAGGGPMGIS